MVEIRLSDQSLDDMENIAGFIAKDPVKYAKIRVKRFFESTEISMIEPPVR